MPIVKPTTSTEPNRQSPRAAQACPGLRLIVVFLLSLALAFAGGTRSMALTHPPGSVAMVICSENGEETIFLDARGTPVDQEVDCAKCPECMSNPLPILTYTTALAVPPKPQAARFAPPAETPAILSRHLRPQSRGPPRATPEHNDTALQAVTSSLGESLQASPRDRIERVSLDARS